jgi:hypothetical protein
MSRNTNKIIIGYCPCDSGKAFSECCKPFLYMLGLSRSVENAKTIFFDWQDKYGPATSGSFHQKTKTYLFRISVYLDEITDTYVNPGFPENCVDSDSVSDAFFSLKHNVILSVIASYRCLAEGLFLQSGILLRSAIENCFVILDVCLSQNELKRFLENNYNAGTTVARLKKYLPREFVRWYGYLSANFTHVGIFHQAPYLPCASYPNNWVIVTGLQNIVRVLVVYHALLERVYLQNVTDPMFWKKESGKVIFNSDSKVFEWAAKMGADVVQELPPDPVEKTAGKQGKKSYTLKG